MVDPPILNSGPQEHPGDALVPEIPHRKVVALPPGGGALLECGHTTWVEYGEAAIQCMDCVKEPADKIMQGRYRLAAECQQTVTEALWDRISGAFVPAVSDLKWIVQYNIDTEGTPF